MKLTESTTIQRNHEILTSDLDGEKVMMSIRFGEYYGLGKTGSFIWDQLENPIKIKDLVDLITSKYEVEKEKCYQDILPFITDLIEKELLIATK